MQQEEVRRTLKAMRDNPPKRALTVDSGLTRCETYSIPAMKRKNKDEFVACCHSTKKTKHAPPSQTTCCKLAFESFYRSRGPYFGIRYAGFYCDQADYSYLRFIPHTISTCFYPCWSLHYFTKLDCHLFRLALERARHVCVLSHESWVNHHTHKRQ